MNGRGVFITATDTEVGKTFVACALAARLRGCGVDVGVAKPFASGGRADRSGRLVNGDARLLRRLSESADSMDEINPVCLKAPLAPAVAAEREGVKIDTRLALSAARRIMRRHAFTIVEGCGGLLVPITTRRMMIDLIPSYGLPVVLVARADLGTINHSLLSVEALQKRGITPAAIVLNRCDGGGGDLSIKTNACEIRRRASCPVFGPIAHLPGLQPIYKSRKRLGEIPAISQLSDLLLK